MYCIRSQGLYKSGLHVFLSLLQFIPTLPTEIKDRLINVFSTILGLFQICHCDEERAVIEIWLRDVLYSKRARGIDDLWLRQDWIPKNVIHNQTHIIRSVLQFIYFLSGKFACLLSNNTFILSLFCFVLRTSRLLNV